MEGGAKPVRGHPVNTTKHPWGAQVNGRRNASHPHIVLERRHNERALSRTAPMITQLIPGGGTDVQKPPRGGADAQKPQMSSTRRCRRTKTANTSDA